MKLFTDEQILYPPGFSYFENFLDEAEEFFLLDLIKQTALHTFIFQGYEAKRLVASFGYDWNFTTRTLSPGKPIPHEFLPIVRKVATKISVDQKQISELLITEYPPGSVINWHRDAPPFDTIAGLSLGSDCTFRLRPHEKVEQTRKSIISIPVRRRSVYIIRGEARTNWQHSISPVTNTRYSLTFRTLKHDETTVH